MYLFEVFAKKKVVKPIQTNGARVFEVFLIVVSQLWETISPPSRSRQVEDKPR